MIIRLFPYLLVKIQKFFSCMCWRRMFCFSVHRPWEKNLKSFPFKMVLSWKQCSCDVIIERVYCLSACGNSSTVTLLLENFWWAPACMYFVWCGSTSLCLYSESCKM
jgi:hypothetical protein